jgi:hypothetical protein
VCFTGRYEVKLKSYCGYSSYYLWIP